MEVDSLASSKSDAFWNEEREVPLTEAEVKGFKEADSLYVFERAKMTKDSISSLPRFKFSHLLLAKRYNYEKKGLGNSFLLGLFGFGFTPIDGFYLNREIAFNHQVSETDYWKLGANMRYGFIRKVLNGDIYFDHKSDEGRSLLNISAGSQVANFSSAKTLPMTLNSSTSLFNSMSYLYWYQKDFVRLSYQYQIRASLKWSAQVEYRNRSAISNVVSYGWYNQQNRFHENYPLTNELTDTRFATHDQWSLAGSITWRPGTTWRLINRIRRISRPEHDLTMHFDAQWVLGNAGFAKIGIQLDQRLNLNRLGQLAYQVRYDDFLKRPTYFMDFTHFNGNEVNLVSNLPFGYSLLPYYQFSTSNRSLIFHAKWSPRKFLYTQNQFLYMYGLREHLRFSSLQKADMMGKDGYYELAYSLQGIFRAFGVEVAKPVGNWVPNQWKVSISMPF
jgi:hypothetical protein